MIPVAVFLIADLLVSGESILRAGYAAPTLMAVTSALMAGFFEEATFRLLPVSTMMRTYKDKDSYLTALILPAVVFGLYHLMNLAGGADLECTLVQVVSATVAGLFFAALYLRTGSLILPVFLHALHDFLSKLIASQQGEVLNYDLTVMDYVEVGTIMIVQIILIIWLLKGHKDDIIATWKKVWNTSEE